MFPQNVEERVRWQDLKVMSELDIVLDIAKTKGWEDCEVFGSGDMITQPRESKGWELIPADLYEDSIPPEAVGRLSQIINAGIRVRGVIIADDQRRSEPTPAPAPARPNIFRSAVRVLQAIGQALGSAVDAIVTAAGIVMSFLGKALFRLLQAACVVALVAFFVYSLIHFFWPVLLLGGFIAMVSGAGSGTSVKYDPKLIVLVDDGKGGTAWISLYTWYN